jgi:hypothetical protein
MAIEDGIDSRSWTDKMFLDRQPDGSNVTLEVVAHDCNQNANFVDIDVVHNTISLLVDFAADAQSKHSLKGEHVLVVGGNRPTRSGLGRLWVPASQLPTLIAHLQSLNSFLDSNLDNIVGRVRSNRETSV